MIRQDKCKCGAELQCEGEQYDHGEFYVYVHCVACDKEFTEVYVFSHRFETTKKEQ